MTYYNAGYLIEFTIDGDSTAECGGLQCNVLRRETRDKMWHPVVDREHHDYLTMLTDNIVS